MKRKKKPKKKLKVDAILTADWHLREDTPTCRTDDFEEAQWNNVRQVSDLQRKYNCPVFHAGDLFHHWKPSPYLLTKASDLLPRDFWTIYGQHDLPQHNLDLADKSGLFNLAINQRIEVIGNYSPWNIHTDNNQQKGLVQFTDKINLEGCHWNQEPIGEILSDYDSERDRKVLVWHHLTYQSKPFPGAKHGMAGGLLRKYSQFDLILTGDNHQAFTEKYKGRLLVNPGNLTRQVANQADFRPRVYLWNAKANIVKPVYLDIEKDVVSRQHIEQKEERDERISAFVERLGTEWEGDLDFQKNLEKFEQENDIEEEVMEIAYKALEAK